MRAIRKLLIATVVLLIALTLTPNAAYAKPKPIPAPVWRMPINDLDQGFQPLCWFYSILNELNGYQNRISQQQADTMAKGLSKWDGPLHISGHTQPQVSHSYPSDLSFGPYSRTIRGRNLASSPERLLRSAVT